MGALDGDEWSASCPCHFTSGERAPSLIRKLYLKLQTYTITENYFKDLIKDH
jgi:hypothetical protein